MKLRKNNLLILIEILHTIIILPVTFALSKLYENCYVESESKYGVCVNKNNCKMLEGQKGNAKLYQGFCEGSSEIQCCIKTVTTLTNGTNLPNEGTCKNVNECPTNSNTLYSDQCPGNNDVKLCVPNSKYSATTTTSNIKSTVITPTPAVYHYKVGVRTMDIVKKTKAIKESVKEFINDSINTSYKELDSTMEFLDNHKDDLEWYQYPTYWEGKLLQWLSNTKTGKFIFDVGDKALKAAEECIDNINIDYFIDLINIRHVAFSIDNYIFEYSSYKNKEGKVMVGYYFHENNMEEIQSYDWDSLSYLSGTTTISPSEMNTIIKEQIKNGKFPYKTEEAKFLSGTCCTEYHLFLNNCHDFVKSCLTIVDHNSNDLSKFITFKTELGQDTFIVHDLKYQCAFISEEEFSKWFIDTVSKLITEKESECKSSNTASIAGNEVNDEYVIIQSCNIINANNTGNISDNNLKTNGFEDIRYFSLQYAISAFMLMITWWIFILH